MDWFEILEINVGKRKSEDVCLVVFKVWFSNFSSKEETMRKIHDWNVAELVYWIIVYQTHELGIYFA